MPPTRGEETRERILANAARLFNERGFSGASVNDILDATGLQKGGLYNHFASKEDLAAEAFEYAVGRVTDHFHTRLHGRKSIVEKLYALVDAFVDYAECPPVPGGCPIMNLAIDSDDFNPRLRERARRAMDEYLGGLADIVRCGIQFGELKPAVNPDQAALVLMSMFDCGLMLSRLHGSPQYMHQAADYMRNYVEQLCA